MDIGLSFKKYVENYRIVFITTVLFVFVLFIINPVFSLFGGSLNLSYNLFTAYPDDIVSSLLAVLIMLFIYSVLQTMIIFKVGNTYCISRELEFKDIKKPFYRILSFNWIYFLVLYFLSLVLYKLNLFNNIITQLILFIVTVFLWFVPQIVVMENQGVLNSIYISITYWKNNWFHLITLLVASFALVFIAMVLDAIFVGITGTIISVIFMVLFVIPYIEIIKTEIYLNKYKLLKPRHQL